MTTSRCEECGSMPARKRLLEPCASESSASFVEQVCIMHKLCDDCYSRYLAMEEDDQELFRAHLAQEGLGVTLEL